MKRWSQRLVIFAVMVILIITPFFEKQSYGWTVTIQNNTTKNCSYTIWGNQLLTSSRECTGTVNPGKTEKCTLPGAVCPCMVDVACGSGWFARGSTNPLIMLWSTKCWDSTVTIPVGGVTQTEWKWINKVAHDLLILLQTGGAWTAISAPATMRKLAGHVSDVSSALPCPRLPCLCPDGF